LPDDIDAVFVIFDHALNATQMAFNIFQAV
jgi:hypothetical protein